ncbi:MAG TPA: amidase, partial [Caldimonas sp.]
MLTFEDYRKHDAVGLAQLVARRRASAEELLATAIERSAAINPAINALSQEHFERARAAIGRGLPDGPFR